MKSRILQKIIAVGAILIMGTSGVVPVMADGGKDPSTGDSGTAATGANSLESSGGSFLGLVPWYEGVEDVVDSNTVKLHESCEGVSGGCMELGVFVAKVAANILTDVTMVAAYLALGFVIYGGYLYIFSYGDVGKVAAGKKTLTSAFIGLAIVMLAYVIFNTIRFVLVGAGVESTTVEIEGITYTLADVKASQLFENVAGWVIGISGLVAAVFLVYGGITYVTSSGDAGKVEKAKKVILYSLIGLAIVGLSYLITGAISTAIRESAKVESTSNAKVLMIGKGGQR